MDVDKVPVLAIPLEMFCMRVMCHVSCEIYPYIPNVHVHSTI